MVIKQHCFAISNCITLYMAITMALKSLFFLFTVEDAVRYILSSNRSATFAVGSAAAALYFIFFF